MELIRATSLLHYPELVSELGADPGPLLLAAGICPDEVGRDDVFFALRAGVNAVEAAAGATGTPDFGRRLATRQGIEILGAIGVAARTAHTLGDALSIFDRFMAAYSPGISVTLLPHADPDLVFFEHRVELSPPPPQVQTVELSLGIMLRVLRLLLGADFAPTEVHLPHRPLGRQADYRFYFGCPVRFAQPAAGLCLPATKLSRPMRRNAQTHQTAMSYLDGLTDGRRPTMARAVADVARHLLPTGTATVGTIATQFGMHPKALQRKLAAEQTSFAEVLDRVRREMAERYLRDPEITLSHLTYQLGYAEQSVLSRACQRWFGTSPSHYRASALAESG